jgi:hypothetical protein
MERVDGVFGRGERIRTSDLSVPNRAHYQAVLRPDVSPEEFHDRRFRESGHSSQRRKQRSRLAGMRESPRARAPDD